ncbi:hypothetical protein [Burkholderia multivorans]|uniref:hypothetical protein n=1 Tax=Burkholderia multivorans TaxID=87883 RepID=UPI0021BE5B1B|nr:hypothetical protein [Burkholderia multivorans]
MIAISEVDLGCGQARQSVPTDSRAAALLGSELSDATQRGAALLQYSVVQILQYQFPHILRASEPQIGCTTFNPFMKIRRQVDIQAHWLKSSRWLL